MVESKRKKNRVKKKPVKWYTLRIYFWAMLLSLCFVMLGIGFMLGKYY